MKNLKRLALTFTLSSVLAVAAFAGETNPPTCAPDPGITSTPPCASAQMTADDAVSMDDRSTRSDSTLGAEVAVADVTIDLLQSLLLLF